MRFSALKKKNEDGSDATVEARPRPVPGSHCSMLTAQVSARVEQVPGAKLHLQLVPAPVPVTILPESLMGNGWGKETLGGPHFAASRFASLHAAHDGLSITGSLVR